MNQSQSPAHPVTLSPPHPVTWSRVALGLVLLIAAALRFYALDASSLWSDEGNTWALVQRAFGEIARDAAADIHPPGYYWLLKGWTTLFGVDAYALRAFSALCGVLLVAATYLVARQLIFDANHTERAGGDPLHPSSFILHPSFAAWIVALNPLHVYYSQEARMYMPLALAGAGLYASLLAYTRRERTGQSVFWAGAAFWACGAAGLWLHYSFPILLLGAGLYYLLHWLQQRTLFTSEITTYHLPMTNYLSLLRFAALCVGIVATFLPWLPTAVRQVLNWPQGNVEVGAGEGLRLTLETLLFGPLRTHPDPAWPWLWGAAILPLLGLWAIYRYRAQLAAPAAHPPVEFAIGLWLLGPIAMMFTLGLFTDAFLKFLLAASPAWAIALVWAVYTPLPLARTRVPHWMSASVLGALIGVASVWLAATTLPHYYTDPMARDNYAGVARYVAAHARLLPPLFPPQPGGDERGGAALVLLNAPGQRDVWNYYDPGVPVLALPATRPPDRDATEAALQAAIQDKTRVFALYWATDESDPDGIVEQWLDRHAFPGLESWQGNLRLVDYSLPVQLACTPLEPPARFGSSDADALPQATLASRCVDAGAQRSDPDGEDELTAAAGDVLLVGLGWEFPDAASTAQGPLAVSLQLLDARNQVAAQRDAPLPGPDAPDIDNHGIPVPVGAPPGEYRLILALYDPQTGARLPVSDGTMPEQDALALGATTITRGPVTAAPLIDARHAVNRALGPVTLLGYDLHRKDFGHAPETPVSPGDLVQITLYWQAPPVLPDDWPDDLHFDLRLGDQQLHAPLAGGAYPTGQWQPHEVVRARFEIPFDGGARYPHLTVAGDTLRLRRIPN